MAVEVKYNKKARADLVTIFGFLLDQMEEPAAITTLKAISEAIESLANTPLISGSSIAGMPGNYRRSMILKKRYWVIFSRNEARTVFQVWRVWPTHQRPLTPNQIRP